MDDEFEGVEWDESKSDWNRAHLGFGFDFAADVFAVDYVQSENCGRELGEPRFVAIGCVDDLVITIIWTPRGRNRRIISARLASRRERRLYYGSYPKETE